MLDITGGGGALIIMHGRGRTTMRVRDVFTPTIPHQQQRRMLRMSPLVGAPGRGRGLATRSYYGILMFNQSRRREAPPRPVLFGRSGRLAQATSPNSCAVYMIESGFVPLDG